jgi:hypothetical protein
MKNTFKVKAIQRIAAIRRIAGIIALMAIIGFSMAACGGGDDNGSKTKDDGSGSKTKFEGRWLNEVAINEYGFNDFSFTFTGNNFTFKSAGRENNTYKGTFTFTDTAITFTPTTGETWSGFSQKYTLSGNTLDLGDWLSGSRVFGVGPFTKQ